MVALTFIRFGDRAQQDVSHVEVDQNDVVAVGQARLIFAHVKEPVCSLDRLWDGDDDCQFGFRERIAGEKG